MKKSVGLIFIILLGVMANCTKKCPECPPAAASEVVIQEALDSVETDAIFTSQVQGMLPYKLQKEWKYRKLYRVCLNVTVPRGKKVQLIFHKKNLSELFTLQLGPGQQVYTFTARQLFVIKGYVSAQEIDAATSVVLKHIPLQYDSTVNYCPPTSSERDKISGSTTTGTTVTVTVDEM